MTTSARFRRAYADYRAAEGRGKGGAAELLALPYPTSGPLTREWAVRARTYERFLDVVIGPRAREVTTRPITVLDLGAGNGWLCHRLGRLGHQAAALDWRRDTLDGLGAAALYRDSGAPLFPRIAASFQAIPVRDRSFDVVVFNAALHYADDLTHTITEATRVTAPGGRIAILDSPFYRTAIDGELMVAEKRSAMARALGEGADDLLALRAVEYLTRERLEDASFALPLVWRRHRVWYPLWYELRPLVAGMTGSRTPSRFDLWETKVS